MIGIKSFHLFFISMSILLSGWYGYFEIATPSNPGSLSTTLSIISFMVTVFLKNSERFNCLFASQFF